jgi:hypothetical protein
MSKTIIKKEVTEYGSIEIMFYKRDDSSYCERMVFDDEMQLKAFAYLLKLMVSTDAGSIGVE